MPSSNKTSYLRLNKFTGTDMPKMADFNGDNQIIDSRFQAHEENGSIHLTAAQVTNLAKSGIVAGSYVGNGSYERKISLGYAPTFGVLFAVGKPFSWFEMNSMTNEVFGGFFSKFGCTEKLGLNGSTLTVYQYETLGSAGKTYFCNQQGVTYVYILWK